MNNNAVAVLFGGRGVEHGVSCLSAGAVLSHFPEEYSPLPVFLDAEGGWYLFRGERRFLTRDFAPDPASLTPTFPVRLSGTSGFLSGERILPVFAALPVLHGDFGEDGRVQGALDTARIPYAGAGVLTGAVATDKEMTKLVARDLGIPTLPHLALSGEDATSALGKVCRALGHAGKLYPLFVKPASLGSSVGASPAFSDAAFIGAYEAAAKYGKVLVEPLAKIDCEIEVAYLDGDEPIVSEPGAIRSSHGFYDYEDKYETKRASVSDAPDLPASVVEAVRDYTQRLARAFSPMHLFRADYFLSCDGQIFFNELNPIPGMTETSLYPRLLARMGVPFAELIRRLVRLAHDRRV